MKYTVVATLIFSVALVAAQGCESLTDCDSCANDASGLCGWCSPQGVCLNTTQNYNPLGTPVITGDQACATVFQPAGTFIANSTECAAAADENCTATYTNDCSNPACGFCQSGFFTAQCFQAVFNSTCAMVGGSWNECSADNSTTTGEPSSTTGEPSSTTGEPSSTTSGSATTASESDSEGAVTVVSMILLVAMILVALF